jgi:hypothetical protein
MLTTNKKATTSKTALIKTAGFKQAVQLSGNKTVKYTYALGLYLQPQGATSNEVMAFYTANGLQAEPMLNCYRKAAAGKAAESVEQMRSVKGSTKQYKAYTLRFTGTLAKPVVNKRKAAKATKAAKAAA